MIKTFLEFLNRLMSVHKKPFDLSNLSPEEQHIGYKLTGNKIFALIHTPDGVKHREVQDIVDIKLKPERSLKGS